VQLNIIASSPSESFLIQEKLAIFRKMSQKKTAKLLTRYCCS